MRDKFLGYFETPQVSASTLLPALSIQQTYYLLLRDAHITPKLTGSLVLSPVLSLSRLEMMSSDDATAVPPLQAAQHQIAKLQRQYQQTLDKWTPHILQRWLGTLGLVALFMLRIVLSQGVRCIFSICLV